MYFLLAGVSGARWRQYSDHRFGWVPTGTADYIKQVTGTADYIKPDIKQVTAEGNKNV